MASAIYKTAVDSQFTTGEYLPIFERYMAGKKSATKKVTLLKNII